MKRFVAAVLRWGSIRHLVLLGLFCVAAHSVRATDLPPGYVETDVFSMGGITSFDWTPDGVMWIAQTGGLVHRYDGGPLLQALSVYGSVPPADGERGLHTIVVDPEYATNAYMWVFYTYYSPNSGPIFNRVSRFTNVNDQLVNEVVVLDGPPVSFIIHNGGCLAFVSDGTLFVGFGDDSQGAVTAQDPFDLRGSIVHINRDGSPAADNPFLDGTAGDPRVWAMGLRNPFRCSVDLETDNLFISDVGSSLYEEINLGVPGGNFGWPIIEGPEPPGTPGFVYPTYAYDSREDPAGAAVIAGDHVEPGEFNPAYEANFFFADYARSEIYRMELDEAQNPVEVETWATDAAQPVALRFGPDGALYYAARAAQGGKLRRIEYVGGANSQPVAVADATPDSGPAPLLVSLDGTQSSDPDDDPLTYSWDLGDSGSASDPTVMHSYPQGVYEITLTVDDGNGLDDDSPPLRVVSGNIRPTAMITSPLPGTMYNAGDSILYTGSATDPEDGVPPCAQFSWQVLFHHLGHTHPFLGPIEGSCSGSFLIPTGGETSSDVWYRLYLQVTDSGAPIGSAGTLTDTQQLDILPNTSFVTFESAPLPDLTLTLDTVPFTAPVTVESVVNMTRQIGAVDTLSGQHTYRWIFWSDAGPMEHPIMTPATPTTFTATFGCDVLDEVQDLSLHKQLNGAIRFLWSPVVDTCLAGTDAYRIYSASESIPADSVGQFPSEPAFTMIGTSDTEEFDFAPAVGDRYFLVTAAGTDQLDGPVGHYPSDVDGDGIAAGDNCPLIANPLQEDLDEDGYGDACDGNDLDWWDAQWQARVKLSFDNSTFTEDLVNFPVAIVLPPGSPLYALTQGQGQDVRFVDRDGTTVLDHHAETWNTSGTSVLWVRVPKVNAATGVDYIWMYIDNLGAADVENPAGVWGSGYVGVWHLSETPSNGGQFFDSTANGLHGDFVDNDGDSDPDASGQLGGGIELEGDDDYIDLGNPAALPAGLAERTLCVWAEPTSVSAGYRLVAAFGSPGLGTALFIGRTGTTLVSGGFGSDVNQLDFWDTDWHHVCLTYDGTTARLYGDGLLLRELPRTWNFTPQEAYIGRQVFYPEYWEGQIDEVRISDTVRSAEWIRAQFQSQSNSFVLSGPIEPAP